MSNKEEIKLITSLSTLETRNKRLRNSTKTRNSTLFYADQLSMQK